MQVSASASTPPASTLRQWFSQPLTIERTMAIILFLLIFALATRIPLDTDTWWHLRAGQWMVENRQILTVDLFSYTKTNELRIPAEWLTQIVLYGIWQVGREFGLALYTSVLATLGCWLLFRACEGSTYIRAFLIVLAASTAAVFWSARPQMFTFVLCALMMVLLFTLYKRRGIDRLWWCVPIMLVWAALHGGFFLGLVMLYAVIAGEVLNHLAPRFWTRLSTRAMPPDGTKPIHTLTVPQIRKLMLVAALSTAALLINPVGYRLLLLPFETFTLGALRAFIQEWNPPDLSNPSVYPFVVLLLATVGMLVAHWRRMDWSEVILVGGAAYLGLTAARNISFFAVVATPILSYHLHHEFTRRGWSLRTITRSTRRMVRLNRLLIALVVVGTLAKVLLVLDSTAVEAAKRDLFPVDAVVYLNETQPQGRLFNSYNWGGYLMFHAPQYPVYIDGRTDLYNTQVFEYASIAFAEDGWRESLDAMGIDLVFVESVTPLAQQLAQTDGWTTLYSDDLAAIFQRES